MEATCSSETSVDFQRIIRRYIPENITLYYHHFENLKSYLIFLVQYCLYLFDMGQNYIRFKTFTLESKEQIESRWIQL
jgi:hypothetical protein